MFCDMQPTAVPNVYRCSRKETCERVVVTHQLPIYAECGYAKPKPLVDCIHFGLELGRTPCVPCGGTRIKVFSCTVHMQCQLGDKLDYVKSCENCGSKSPL